VVTWEVKVSGIDWMGQAYVLTKRELEVVEFLMAAKSVKQIAWEMGICVPTVAIHTAHIRRKLGVHNTAGILGTAYRGRSVSDA
jgi:DNA-binding CsgD family transcriptional regulator